MEEYYIITTEAGDDSLLSVFSDVANVIIALLSLCFGVYIFYHQKIKADSEEQKSDQLLQESIKLQWFKEIIIQPNLGKLYGYFSSLYLLRSKISTLGLNDESRVELIKFIKEESADFRKTFISTLHIASPALNRDAQSIIDTLSDSITNILDDEDINLMDSKTFDDEIGDLIQRARNSFVGLIFNFKGTTS